VHGDVEIAAHERGDEVAPVVLHEPLADGEALRQPLGDEQLEALELRRIARIPIDEWLTALQIAGPGQFAAGADPVEPADEGEKTAEDVRADHEILCEGSGRATQWVLRRRDGGGDRRASSLDAAR